MEALLKPSSSKSSGSQHQKEGSRDCWVSASFTRFTSSHMIGRPWPLRLQSSLFLLKSFSSTLSRSAWSFLAFVTVSIIFSLASTTKRWG